MDEQWRTETNSALWKTGELARITPVSEAYQDKIYDLTDQLNRLRDQMRKNGLTAEQVLQEYGLDYQDALPETVADKLAAFNDAGEVSRT